ncbi:MAG: PilZ domain-containing protein [Pseudomonadota bacterium]
MEKRRYKRAVPVGSVIVYDAVTRSELGTLGNLSSHGLMVIATAPVDPDLLFQLEFEVTGPDDEPVAVNIGAESLWCSPASQPDRYWAGFEIVEISDDDRALIEAVTE